MSAGEVFIPRTSVKKLVLRSRPSETSNLTVGGVTCEEGDVDVDKSITIGLGEIIAEKNKLYSDFYCIGSKKNRVPRPQ